jgi:hypothetical protein
MREPCDVCDDELANKQVERVRGRRVKRIGKHNHKFR